MNYLVVEWADLRKTLFGTREGAKNSSGILKQGVWGVCPRKLAIGFLNFQSLPNASSYIVYNIIT